VANRLAAEPSPYLRQHADNPVEWYPWGEEAFAAAAALDRPVLVSIGYSACHWCHVMAHESFEDEATARQLNEGFVAVKVDREERPDVDAVYLEAVQALTGSGGWPLTVFTDARGRPFFGGTYFPKEPRPGAPSFRAVLDAVSEAWAHRRDAVLAEAEELTASVAARLGPPPPGGKPSQVRETLEAAVERFAAVYDPEHGGVGRAPKFPQAPLLELALVAHLAGYEGMLDKVVTTLEAMASGGIYDHLGGGFCRYAVDRAWQVPHFEKMLYDQAGLARLYLHAWQVTGDERFRQVVDETLSYVLRDLRAPDGGLYSAEDADSEGEEGRFYTWRRAELDEVLGERAGALAAAWYGVSEAGNFESGRNILHRAERGDLLRPPEIEAARAALHAARARRVRPGLDDKVLTEWNAMAVSALAEAAGATGERRYLDAAVDVARYLLAHARRPDGRWLRSVQGGRGAHLAVAGDYAWLVECFTRLAEATGEPAYLAEAKAAADGLIELFSAEDGGFYQSGRDAPALVVRPRDLYDGATPAASSVATLALARLGALLADDELGERARAALDAARPALARAPLALPHLLQAALLLEGGIVEVAIPGDQPELAAVARRAHRPQVVLATGAPGTSPLVEGREPGLAYVCERGTCLAPAATPAELAAALDAATSRCLERW